MTDKKNHLDNITHLPFAKASTPETRPRVGLALQGMGAHGAFTWGVLDALLEADIDIVAITGTSSGALNGSMVAAELEKGDRRAASQKMADTWKTFSNNARGTIFHSTAFEHLAGTWPNLTNPLYMTTRYWIGEMSERNWNFMRFNPISSVLGKMFDINALRKGEKCRFYANALNPKTMECVVTGPEDMSVEAIAASCNLPDIMPPVEHKGAVLWDGGFIENPSVGPLIEDTDVTDIIVVQLIPDKFATVPTTAKGIHFRKLLSFLSIGLNKTLRAVEDINKMIESGALDAEKAGKRQVHLHKIVRPEHEKLGPSSAENLDWSFLTAQHDDGYTFAKAWLSEHKPHLGVRSTASVGGPSAPLHDTPKLRFG